MTILQHLGLERINKGSSSMLVLDSKCITYMNSIDPSRNQVIAQISNATQTEYADIIEQAQAEFIRWKALPAPKRGELIRQIAQVLRAQKESLGALISLEMGKSKQEGEGEVQEMIDIADFAVGLSRMLYGLTMPSERANHRMMEQWHPLGVVGVITAFNFPMAVWAWNAFIAAVCGNTIVWKPSSKVALCAIAVQNICNAIMKPAAYSQVFNFVVSEDLNLGAQLAQDSRVPLISFTGSCKIGKEVAQMVAHRMGRSILELGGNNAVIIDETANLSLAIPAIVFGAIGTAGQRCTSTRRVFIHHTRFAQVVDALKQAYAQVPKELMGPLIDRQAVEQYQAAIKLLQEQGATILYGGKIIEAEGCFVEPTLVVAQNDWPLVQTETFAPILYLMQFETIEEAIRLQNQVPQGLSSALFTDSVCNAELFLSTKGSDCGIANINIGTSGAEIGAAFGGEKETGGGREAGSDAWKAYMRRQTNTINWGNTLPLSQGIIFLEYDK